MNDHALFDEIRKNVERFQYTMSVISKEKTKSGQILDW